MSRSNGRLEPPEVIINYLDGFAYAKHKLDEAFLPGGLLNKPVATKPPAGKGDPSLKKEDIDVIVHEFEIPRIQAEKVLVENGGDLEKALRALCGLNIAFANT